MYQCKADWCVTNGDVGRGVAEYDPQSIWNPLKTADLS